VKHHILLPLGIAPIGVLWPLCCVKAESKRRSLILEFPTESVKTRREWRSQTKVNLQQYSHFSLFRFNQQHKPGGDLLSSQMTSVMAGLGKQ
ncbi:hypothetical protein XENOCAPTIV_024973, partial [Xenoophorus captivus]